MCACVCARATTCCSSLRLHTGQCWTWTAKTRTFQSHDGRRQCRHTTCTKWGVGAAARGCQFHIDCGEVPSYRSPSPLTAARGCQFHIDCGEVPSYRSPSPLTAAACLSYCLFPGGSATYGAPTPRGGGGGGWGGVLNIKGGKHKGGAIQT